MKMRRLPLLLLLLLLVPMAAPAETLTLTFVGDTSIGDAFKLRDRPASYHTVVKEQGMHWPFSLVANVTLNDDLTIANLEGSMTTRKRHKDVVFPLFIDPAHAGVLTAGGIDAVNTANNHALDFFNEGYQDTLHTLDQAGIAHFGTLSPAGRPGLDRQTIVERKGVKIGFIGYTYPQNRDLKSIEQAAKSLREAGCGLIILSLHWGRETFMTPESAQHNFAKQALKLDIDLIYGHHPHVLQPIALYNGKPVLFSTGNFTFGTMSKVDRSTGLFQVEYDLSGDTPQLSALRVIPCETTGPGDYRPTPVTGEAARRAVFEKLMYKRPPEGFEPLPDSFLVNGEALFPVE